MHTSESLAHSKAARPVGRWLTVLVIVLVCVRWACALPYLSKPIPASYHPGNEAVVTAAAILRNQHGLDAMQVVTPPEGRVELRLHSWLAAPLLTIGYTEGGRLVSWLASLLSVFAVFLIGRFLWDECVGAIGSLLLAVSPTFTLFSYHILPANLSVLLTCLAVLITVLPGSLTGSKKLLLIGLFSLATLNHIWEVVILLPMVVLLWKRRAWRTIITLIVLGVLISIANVFIWGTNYFRVGLSQQRHIQAYSFLYNSELFLSPSWWLPLDRLQSPVGIVASGYFLLALGGVSYIGLRLAQGDRSELTLLMASWLIAGLAPIFLLPGHYVGHDYSVWGLLAPVSLGLASAVGRVLSRLDSRVLAVLLAGVTGLSIGFLFVSEQRLRDEPYAHVEKLAVRDAGLDLYRYMESSGVQPTEVTILVGVDESSQIARSYFFTSHQHLGYFLIYSRLNPVYLDSMDQSVVDNLSTDLFAAPEVVGGPDDVPGVSRILISTQVTLEQYPEWRDRYSSFLEVGDVVVLLRR